MPRPTTRIDRESFHSPHIDGLVLYRCYGLDGTLMYIGQTSNLRNRINTSHRHKMPWWNAVEYITVQQYSNRESLRYAERRAIWMEEPFFNQQRYNRSQLSGPTAPLWNRQRQLSRLEPEKWSDIITAM